MSTSITALPRPRQALAARTQRAAGLSQSPTSKGPHSAGRVRLTRRGRLTVLLIFLALALAAFTFVGGPAASTGTSHHSVAATVVVQPGQTLWDIAREVAPHADPRVVVAQITELNDLSDPGAIRAGQPIYVPTP